MHPPQLAEQFVKEQPVIEKDVMSSVSMADITEPFLFNKLIDSAVRERDADEMVGDKERRGLSICRVL